MVVSSGIDSPEILESRTGHLQVPQLCTPQRREVSSLSRKPVVLGTLALAAALAPAHAGTVYVPTIQRSLGGIHYRTEIVVANTGATAGQLTTSFIPAESDGTRAAEPRAPLSILPRATFVLTNAAPAGRDGLLAVSGAGEMAVTARLLAVAASGQVLGSAPLPAIGSQGSTAPGGAAQIRLILRGDKAKTILDLGKEQMAKGDGPWKERTQYHVRMETDAGSRTVTLKLFQGNNLVHIVSGGLVANDLSVPSGKTVSVDFGIARAADGAYFPPVGWKYSNLSVKAEPF
jgi:hypothetical protein